MASKLLFKMITDGGVSPLASPDDSDKFMTIDSSTGEMTFMTWDQLQEEIGTPLSGESIEAALDGYIGTDWKTGGPGTAWGTVGGTLSNQTDLQAALDAKTDTSTFNGEFSITPVSAGTFRVRSQGVFPGWANTTVAGWVGLSLMNLLRATSVWTNFFVS